MGFTTITMKRETYLKLLKVKAEMQMEKATSSISFTDVLEELIQLYYKNKPSFWGGVNGIENKEGEAAQMGH